MLSERKIHMIGIGGIGMSALAQLLVHEGKEVTGSDRDPAQPVKERLARAGVDIFIGHDAAQVEGAQLVVYSDAIPAENPERQEALVRGIPQANYFEALGEVSKGKRTIAVAGTHGKTTTTGMLGKILIDAGVDPTIIVGSLVSDFDGNFVAGKSDWLLVEACEYQRHFLHLAPDHLVVTNIEWDHPDYFDSLADVQAAFGELIARVPKDGAVITNTEDENIAPLLKTLEARVINYREVEVPELALFGEFNRQNARAAKAVAAAKPFEISRGSCDGSLRAYRGSWRRFEYKGETAGGAEVYDDYAHHPSAIRATLAAAKERFPDKRLVVAFHPHLYSRTKALLTDFAESFHNADRVLVVPIYAAREEPDPSISHELLVKKIAEQGTDAQAYPTLEAIAQELQGARADELVLTMGAGDIYTVAERIVR